MLAQVQVEGGYANYTAKIWDGTTASSSGEDQNTTTSAPAHIVVAAIVSPGSTTTYKVSLACDAAGQAIKAAVLHNAAGNNATSIFAMKIG